MVGSALPISESEGASKSGRERKGIDDDTYNCPWCSVGVLLCDGIRVSHHARADRIPGRPDEQGCGRLRTGLVAWSRWRVPSDGRPPSSVSSRLSYRTRGSPLLAELIQSHRCIFAGGRTSWFGRLHVQAACF